MTESSEQAGLPDRSSPRLRVLHIFALCAFAFTGPVLTALSQQTVFLRDQEVGWTELTAALLVLMLGLPVCCVLLDRAAVRWVGRYFGRGRNAVLFVLGGLVVLSLMRPCARIKFVETWRCAWLLSLAVALPGAWLLARYYERLAALRWWLTISALGLAVFPLSFVWQIEHARRLERNEGSHRRTDVGNPVPVVMIVFDEFSGTSLMDERMQIDARNYPNFARLASQSTWYRRATTVHPRTDIAIPAILSGQFPVTERGPVAANYPGNLLQTIHASGRYDMVVFEPFTRLCPAELKHQGATIPTSRVRRAANLIQTLAAVYPRLILPGDTPLSFPVIPKSWFGLSPTLLSPLRHLTTGLFHYQHAHDRDEQQDHFLDCLRESDRPLFAFFHIMLPHFPWEYLPSGRHYVDQEYIHGDSPPEGLGELRETWPTDTTTVLRNEHRYLLQVGYTDRFVGRLLDRLRETGLLDRCLLIVTADHGVSFRPGRSRRVPDAENIADILSVPLFIKLPGQTTGGVDDRNIESIDLYPTIAEELRIQLSEPVDGSPVSQEARRPRKTLYFEGSMTVVEPTLPQLEAAVQRRLTSFGGGSLELPFRLTASRPDWIGRAVSEVAAIEEPSPDGDTLSIAAPYSSSRGEITTLLVSGFVTQTTRSKSAPEIVLAAGGIICDSYRTLSATHGSFSCLIPESALKSAPVEIELFLVKPDETNGPKFVRQRKWLLQPTP